MTRGEKIYILKSRKEEAEEEGYVAFATALDSAIDTMRKYQKIEQIVEHWACCGNPSDSMIAISEVLEDGDDN